MGRSCKGVTSKTWGEKDQRLTGVTSQVRVMSNIEPKGTRVVSYFTGINKGGPRAGVARKSQQKVILREMDRTQWENGKVKELTRVWSMFSS